MCVLSIKVPIRKKKSGNLFNDPGICEFIYIYIYIYKYIHIYMCVCVNIYGQYLTICKKMNPGSFKDVMYKMCWKSYICLCIKMDLALNNLQWLICHKTKPNLYIVYVCTYIYIYILYTYVCIYVHCIYIYIYIYIYCVYVYVLCVYMYIYFICIYILYRYIVCIYIVCIYLLS